MDSIFFSIEHTVQLNIIVEIVVVLAVTFEQFLCSQNLVNQTLSVQYEQK